MRVCVHCHRTLGDAERTCSRDGADGQDVEPFAFPPALADRFAGVEPFTQSPHSACYLATQPKTGFRGLLKVIPLAGVDASERGRLKRELRKQVKLVHPGLPRLIDGGELPAHLWLLRDHVDGESLAQRLRRETRLELSLALAVAAQVASALDELHRAGILHRDVRPARIVLQARSEGPPLVKLLDAGIAARQRASGVFDLLGTPAYMSPEHIGGKLLSFRSDLYALGCVLYEMLAGRPPFVSSDVRALLEAHERARPPALDRELPAPVSSLLASLLDKEPRKRPFSAQQVRRALEPFLPEGMPAMAPARPASGPMASPLEASRKHPPAPPGFPRHEATEELELAALEPLTSLVPSQAPEIELELTEAAPSGPSTGQATQASVAEAASPTQKPPEEPATQQPQAQQPQAQQPQAQQPQAQQPQVQQPQAQQPQAQQPQAQQPQTSSAETQDAAEAARAGRASVAFDVESLFDAPPSASTPAIDEAAPTLLYQQADGAARKQVHDAQSELEEAGGRESADRTVIVRMPSARSRLPLLAGGAGLVLAVAVVALRCSQKEDGPELAASAAGGTQKAPGAEASPETTPASGPSREEPKAKTGTTNGVQTGSEPARSDAPAGANEPAQPAAEPGTGEPIAAEPMVAEPTPAPTEPATPSDSASPGEAKAGIDAPSSPAPRRSGPNSPVAQRTSRTERVSLAAQYKAEGRAHYQAGRYRDAARAYQRATREVPDDGGAYAGLGASHLALGEAEPAIRAYQRAVQIDRKSSGFQAALGRAYAQAGDRARARAAFTKALELNPNNGAAKSGLDRLR